MGMSYRYIVQNIFSQNNNVIVVLIQRSYKTLYANVNHALMVVLEDDRVTRGLGG